MMQRGLKMKTRLQNVRYITELRKETYVEDNGELFSKERIIYKKAEDIDKHQTTLNRFDGCQSTLQYWIPTEVDDLEKQKAHY